jgi:hypothetical protein
VYAYHQHLCEARERIKRREREAESERLRRELRAQRHKRRRADLSALGLLIAHARRAAGLELDT